MKLIDIKCRLNPIQLAINVYHNNVTVANLIIGNFIHIITTCKEKIIVIVFCLPK